MQGFINSALDVLDPFGYHFCHKNEPWASKKYKYYMNITNFLSYFPYVGILANLYRIKIHLPALIGSQYSSRTKRIAAAHILRAVFQIFTFRIELIIADVVITILRKKAAVQVSA